MNLTQRLPAVLGHSSKRRIDRSIYNPQLVIVSQVEIVLRWWRRVFSVELVRLIAEALNQSAGIEIDDLELVICVQGAVPQTESQNFR